MKDQRSLGVWMVAVALTVFVRDAHACAPAYGAGVVVRVAAEEALIVWDAANGTEHFIRRADFSTDADDFGFLVPTPSPPALGEVSDDVFDRLRDETAPEHVNETEWTFLTCCTSPFMFFLAGDAEAPAMAGAQGVTVLSEQRVAGMDASVLAASDASALGEWLGEHGYENRPALVAWLEPYVEAGYTITAFRYEKRPDEPGVGSRAVRMSFSTDRPFYPYREPSDHPPDFGRTLRVWLVGASRMSAPGWSAIPEYAAPVEASVVADTVPEGAIPEGAWLSSFLDRAAERTSDEDLFFSPVEGGHELHPPPIVHTSETVIPAPVELLLPLGIVIWWWRRRRAKKAPGEGES